MLELKAAFWSGIYTTSEAASLLRERTTTVRRWAFGYTRVRKGTNVEYPPLIKTDLPVIDGEVALTFYELIELLYIRAFERAGVSWHLIKQAASVASRLYDSDHPFALRHVYADPKNLYAALREEDGTESLVQLVGHGQHAIPTLVKPYLEQLDFSVNDLACRWWPLGRDAGVVIDPRRAFGAPILEDSGIQTEALLSAFAAEKEGLTPSAAVKRVAWMYRTSPKKVQAALRFEEWLAAA